MTELPELTPGQLAAFDQAYAESKVLLGDLVDGFAALCHDNYIAGLPFQVSVMELATMLTEHWDSTQLIYALTAAVVRIESS